VARHEWIVNTIWDDLDHLSDDAFMLYMWSFTNTKCGMAGIYPVTRRKLIEGRFETERLTAALAELEDDGKLYYVDGVLWNKARVSHLSGYQKSTLSEFMARSIAKDLKQIDPANPLLLKFLDRYSGHPCLEAHLTPFRPSPEGPQTRRKSRPPAEGPETLQRQRQGQGQSPSSSGEDSPSANTEVFAALERVAFARGRPSPKVDATDRICEQFAQLDLAAEAEKFAHYWTEGPGGKRAIDDVAWSWRQWLDRVRAPAAKSNASPRSTVSEDLRRLEAAAASARAEEAAA
jgi:hypothetical protein